jgi:hypothetical protein
LPRKQPIHESADLWFVVNDEYRQQFLTLASVFPIVGLRALSAQHR